MKLNKIRLSLVIPVISYIVFLSTLYNNITVASTAFFIMVISTIAITMISFTGEGVNKDVKEA